MRPQVTSLVEEKLERKELDKFRLYIDELNKVLHLLLRLSERLARAENAIWALPQNASDKEKVRNCARLVVKHLKLILRVFWNI